MDDPRAEPPEPKVTVSMPAVTERAMLEDLVLAVRNMADNLGTVGQNVAVLMDDRPVLHSRLAGVEGRLARLEQPSIAPPPPLTSTGIRALIDGHPSQMDLSLQAAQAAEAIKNQERDKKIEETHALAEAAAKTLKAQSDYMGMGKRGAQWLISKDGRTALAQAAAALVGAYEVIKHAGVIK